MSKRISQLEKPEPSIRIAAKVPAAAESKVGEGQETHSSSLLGIGRACIHNYWRTSAHDRPADLPAHLPCNRSDPGRRSRHRKRICWRARRDNSGPFVTIAWECDDFPEKGLNPTQIVLTVEEFQGIATGILNALDGEAAPTSAG